MSVTLGLRK